MRRTKTIGKKLNPIEYRTLKAALESQMEDSGEFTDDQISFFMNRLDRLGREDISNFLFIATKLGQIEITEETWENARETIKDDEAEKVKRREEARKKYGY